MLIALALISNTIAGSFESKTGNQIADIKTKYQRVVLENYELRQNVSIYQSNVAAMRREFDDMNKYHVYQIDTLRKELSNSIGRENELIKRFQYSECVEDIEDGRFEEAERKLEKLSSTLQAYVIAKVYNGRMETIQKIDSFAKNLQSVQLKLTVYRLLVSYLEPAARYLTSSSGRSMEDIRIISRLIKSIQFQLESTESLKTEGKAMVYQAINYLKNLAAAELEKYAHDDTFSTSSNDNVNEIYTILSTIDFNLFYDTITVVWIRVYRNVGINRLVQYIDSFHMAGSAVDGYVALFFTIKQFHGLHSQEMVQLAFEFRKVAMHTSTEQLQNLWPTSLAVIASGSCVSIIHYQRNEYLYAPAYQRDDDRRYVFTRKPARQMCIECWNIDRRSDGTLSIQNAESGEYFFLSTYYENEVFTWKPKEDITQNSWQLNPTTNGMLRLNIQLHLC